MEGGGRERQAGRSPSIQLPTTQTKEYEARARSMRKTRREAEREESERNARAREENLENLRSPISDRMRLEEWRRTKKIQEEEARKSKGAAKDREKQQM